MPRQIRSPEIRAVETQARDKERERCAAIARRLKTKSGAVIAKEICKSP